MTENSNKKVPDKNISGKPKFNTNWIFAILAVSIILVEILFSGKSSQKATTNMLKDMIANRDIESMIVVNKEQAEIYLKDTAVESGRYENLPKPGNGVGLRVPKPHFIYNIGDISNFEPFLIETQEMPVMRKLN